ncbi:adenylyltransferase/cytidyltransferase family protein [Candidatus Nanohalococcus occultus]|uniref:adenylyltransferase/cytidyltransferase family protein n=1 Tax=Candidatus Nanohalococcus occultus TaxID=2978047 RepID=UPI0039E18F80
MKRVMAQGCFDVIHPGHLHYLEKSADLGDELVVVVARDSRVGYRKNLAFNEDERVEILNALETVDRAVLGSEDDIYSTVKEIDPDVITVGYDQSHETEEVQKLAEDATDHDVKVKRISGKEDYSSSKIKN